MTSAIAVIVVVAAAATVVGQDRPSELAALVAKARIDGRITSRCRAEFRPGHPGAFALAVTSSNGAGRYVALDSDGAVGELGAFKDGVDLSCYSRREAEKLDRTIKESETIHGQIRPRWNTTVVCGFVDGTSAVCWQYSPAERAFVKVGQWVT